MTRLWKDIFKGAVVPIEIMLLQTRTCLGEGKSELLHDLFT
jgi:hypothetical protein